MLRRAPPRLHLALVQSVTRARHSSLTTLRPLVRCSHKINRTVTTKTTDASILVEDSFIKKFFKKVGWLDHSRTRLKLSGYFLYECVPVKVMYSEWLTECELPDTFATWFAITELHVWLLMVRCMADDVTTATESEKYEAEGEGRVIRNCIVEAMWADIGNRIKLLEGANPSIARKQVAELSEQFQAALVGYDEGLDDDRVLAAAVWRRIFQMDLVDAEHVEKVVKFIRRQMVELDKISSDQLRKNPDINWHSVVET